MHYKHTNVYTSKIYKEAQIKKKKNYPQQSKSREVGKGYKEEKYLEIKI